MYYKNLLTRTVRTHSSNFRTANRGKKDIKYIVIHYTANDGDSDEGNAQYFQSPNKNASAHFFVDDDSITETVNVKDIAWHCGGSVYKDVKSTGGAKYHGICTNTNSIGIEMCDTRKDGTYNLSEKTRNNTIKLVRALMKDYNIDINHVVTHFNVTGKYCPRYFCKPYGSDAEWLKFKQEIVNGLDMNEEDTKAEKEQSTEFRVRVSIDDLNIRVGAGTNYRKTGRYTGKGVFTIVEVKQGQGSTKGWGKLKSGAGWISLDFAQRI